MHGINIQLSTERAMQLFDTLYFLETTSTVPSFDSLQTFCTSQDGAVYLVNTIDKAIAAYDKRLLEKG